MLQSLERNNPTEIDYLNGYIVQKGIELGIPTPINQTIVQLIKDIEQGKKKIDLQHLLQINLT
jgi:2-dehydropantoate 2-reductase